MRTDTIFYQLFLTFPALVFELLNVSPEEGYQFSSREIKELARRFDGIFLPGENQREKPIYFLEVQFQAKADFWWRFLTEIFVYIGQYQPANDWLAVAMFSSRKLDPGLPLQYRALLSNEQIKILYLDELEISPKASIGVELISLIVGSNQEAISKAQQTVNHTRQRIENASEQRKIVELIETVLVYKLKNLSREEIEAMFTMDDLKETRYFQDVRAEAKLEGLQEGRQQGLQEGLQEGRQEGLQEGRQEGLQEGLEKEKTLVVRQLQRKVGNLSPQLEQRVRNLSLEALEDLGEALLDFSGSQDLIDWLNSF